MSEAKKMLLIVNPCAGKTKTRITAEQIVSRFPKDEYEITVRLTERSGHATEIVRECAAEHDLVVCAGGDGTLNETINGVMEMANRIPIGYIPMGSTNDFATTLGIVSNLNGATEVIKSKHKNWYDIGLFNNRYFEYVASFGAFTKASYSTSQKLKNRIGHAAYILTGLTQWKDLKPIHLKVEYDDVVIEDDFYFGAVANSTSVAGLFKFDLNTVRLDDGVFELLLVRRIKSALEAPMMLKKIRRKEYDVKQIVFARTSNVKITCDKPFPWTLDGEFGGEHKQVVINNLCKAIKICSPENALFECKDADEEPNHVVPEVAEKKMTRKERAKVDEKADEVNETAGTAKD